MEDIKRGVKNLIEAVEKNNDKESREMEKETIEELGEDCAEYVKRVAQMENSINVSRFRLSREDYLDKIKNLDKMRKSYHDAVIVGVKVMNRLCALYEIPKIYKGDLSSRIEIAEFAKKYVDQLWDERKL
jgi:porphobilinogen deaminase